MEQTISISSSLAGRDLALLKSMINILCTEEHGEKKRVALQYTDNEDSRIHIYTGELANESTSCYYAKIKGKAAKKIIGTEINPKVLRSFFSSIFSSQSEPATSNGPSEFIQSLYNFIGAANDGAMCIECSEAVVILDMATSTIHSDKRISDIMLAKFSASKAEFSQFGSLNECLANQNISNPLPWKDSLQSILWRMGLIDKDFTLAKHFSSESYSFKLDAWPDFGTLPFNSKHIMMTSIVHAQPASYKCLVEQHGFLPEDVESFINAGCLSGHVRVVSDGSVSSHIIMKSKSDNFLSRLKSRFFG